MWARGASLAPRTVSGMQSRGSINYCYKNEFTILANAWLFQASIWMALHLYNIEKKVCLTYFLAYLPYLSSSVKEKSGGRQGRDFRDTHRWFQWVLLTARCRGSFDSGRGKVALCSNLLGLGLRRMRILSTFGSNSSCMAFWSVMVVGRLLSSLRMDAAAVPSEANARITWGSFPTLLSGD